MIFRPLLQHASSALLVGLFISLGMLTLGKPLLFDRVFFASLLIIAFAFRKDINLLGVTTIIIAERILEEIAYLFVPESFALKILTYAVCLFALYLRKQDSIFYVVLISVSILIGAEIYWVITDFKFISTHWYIYLITLNLFVRKAISSRCFWTAEKFPHCVSEPLKIDYYVYQLAAIFIFINLLTLGEYLLRHILAINSLIIYSNYALINHIIASTFLFLLADQAIKIAQKKYLKV